MKNFLILLLFFLLSGSYSHSSEKKAHLDFCQKYFLVLKNQDFIDAWDEFHDVLDKYLQEEKEIILNNIEAFNFIDFRHQIKDLNKIIKKKSSLSEAFIYEKYNKEEFSSILEDLVNKFVEKKKNWREDSFSNFKDARKFLSTDPGVNLTTFKKVHYEMMKGNIEKIAKEDIGEFRNHSVWGVISNEPITIEQLEYIKSNPYLYFQKNNITPDGKFTGRIMYPAIDSVQEKTLKLLESYRPDLIAEIKNSRSAINVDSKLNKKFLQALVEQRIAKFNQDLLEIGKIQSTEEYEKFIESVASFQRDLVSIHPFANGNGRTTREFAINYILMREGFPPPRLLSTEEDLLGSLDSWKGIINEGVINSRELIKDLHYREVLGLDLNLSPELISPKSLRAIYLSLKKQGSIKTEDDFLAQKIDTKQFLSFYLQYIDSRSGFLDLISKNASQAYKEIIDDFWEFKKKSTLVYDHKKKGRSILELNFADEDFISWIGKKTIHDKRLFDAKMNLWYLDEIIWRGISYRKIALSENKIVSMFSSFNPHLVSNNLIHKIDFKNFNSKQLEKIRSDIRRYNKELFEDEFIKVAKDHSEAGELYRTSYGYSTSKKRVVAKAYAMGAMVIAPYGKHHDLELQKLLKSRVLVGIKRANKDIDLTRLKQLRSEFSYKYGRQQEVLGIGAADPESIEIVQTIDENGKVLLNYYRSPNDPSKVLVFKGEFDPTVDDLSTKEILKIIKL